MQETLIDQGISLMIYGMGTVFVFLTILVFATGLMSKLVRLINKGETNAADSIAEANSPLQTSGGTQPDSNTLEAIKQAISLHRQR